MPKYPEKMREMIGETIRSNIRQAGIELIREQGWSAFTTERIAEKIGLSRGVLYNYFKNKEAIARFIIDSSFDELFTRLEELAAAPRSAAERLCAMAEVNIAEFLSQREMHRIFLEHLPPPGKTHPEMLERHRRRKAIFASVIEDGIRRKEFAVVDVDTAVIMLSGILHELCLRSLFTGEDPDVDGMMKLYLRGIRP